MNEAAELERIREEHQPRMVDHSEIAQGESGPVDVCTTCHCYFPCDVAQMIHAYDELVRSYQNRGNQK